MTVVNLYQFIFGHWAMLKKLSVSCPEGGAKKSVTVGFAFLYRLHRAEYRLNISLFVIHLSNIFKILEAKVPNQTKLISSCESKKKCFKDE